MKFKISVIALLAALLPVSVFAQPVVSPCDNVTGTFTVTSAKPYGIGWVVDATVPVSATDPTVVPNRISGFYVSLDGAAKQDIGLPTAGAACPATSPAAGMIPYTYRMASGVAKGTHTVVVTAYNFALDASGNNTTVRQESGPLNIPFAATDPALGGPPPTPKRGVIIR